jgi:hypothetical protein
MRKQFIIKKTLLTFLRWVIPSECTQLAERSAWVGGAYFEEHPIPRALTYSYLKRLHPPPAHSPCNFHHHAISIISSSSRRAHLESGYGQNNAETCFREWKVYLQKQKKKKKKPSIVLTDSLMQKLQQIKWVCVSVSLGIRMPEKEEDSCDE